MSFLKNTWYVAAHSEDLGREPFARTILNEPVLFYRTEDGRPVAMDNRCRHRLAPLDKGKLFGDNIQCPYHGLQFSPTGACVTVPSGGDPPPRAQLRVYPVAERNSLLWIWMGDPDLANPETIVDFSLLESEAFGWFTGYLHAKANYQLLTDNLLDLSHSEFLHPLLSSDGWCARNRQTITREGETIFVRNVADNDNILPINKLLRPELTPIGTTIHEERWDAPALVQLTVAYYSATGSITSPSGHFLTPETATTTHYFIRGGQDVQPENPEFTAANKAAVLNIFQTQDVPMIEAQQEFLGSVDLMDYEPTIMKADGGGVRARMIMGQKIRKEQTASLATEATLSAPLNV